MDQAFAVIHRVLTGAIRFAIAPDNLKDFLCVLCGSADAEPEASGLDFEYDTAPNRFRFVRCRGCAHLYLNPRPAARDLGVIYPSNYYAFSEGGNPLVARLRSAWEGGKVRLYRELVGDGPRRILDVGCGNGRFLSLLRDHGAAVVNELDHTDRVQLDQRFPHRRGAGSKSVGQLHHHQACAGGQAALEDRTEQLTQHVMAERPACG